MAEHTRRSRKRKRWGNPLWLALPLAALALVLAVVLLRQEAAPGPELKIPVPEELPEWVIDRTIPVNEFSRPGIPMEAMNGIVIHYVGNPGTGAEQNRSFFAGLAQSGETYASSNFVIGLEGEVLLCVPIGEVAYCSNNRNSDTLSIEVCHPDDTGEFTAASYDALVKLVNWLRDFYGLDTDAVIRHYDVTSKECPRYFVEHPDAWERFKLDLSAAEQDNG